MLNNNALLPFHNVICDTEWGLRELTWFAATTAERWGRFSMSTFDPIGHLAGVACELIVLQQNNDRKALEVSGCLARLLVWLMRNENIN